MDFHCEVVVIGGAFSGAATAILLRRLLPDARILIVEKVAEFDRKVGESTTEVSSCFLTKVLGISTYLGHYQLNKQGLRMWFAGSASEKFEDCVEIGGRYNSRLSGFQVDRAKLDEYILQLAVEAGCELWRPAKICALELSGVNGHLLQVEVNGENRQLLARWVVDASGRAAVVARKLELLRPLSAHPVNALWARFSGVKDWDGQALRAKFAAWAEAAKSARSWATNHLMGLGWWCWIIPLRGGDYSIGLVYDTRLFTPPSEGSIAERLRAHFLSHPVGREILSDAQLVGADQRAYSGLPYVSDRVVGDGWMLVGDAASFMDPLYSPGLDFCSFTAQAAASMISRSLQGEDVTADGEAYNARFAFCYQAWFDAIYRDKYFYLGDAELMAAAFLLDIALYHLGPVRQVYADPATQFNVLPFDGKAGALVAKFMAFYNRRLALLAQRKIEAGIYGDRNTNWRLLVGGFLPGATSAKLLFQGLRCWAKAEWRNLFLQPGTRICSNHAVPEAKIS